jgi:hypothetical protein
MAIRSGIRVSLTPIAPRRLALIRTRPMTDDLKTYTREFAEDIVKDLKEYPPPPGGSYSNQRRRSRKGSRYKLRGEGRFGGEYIRTYDLRNAWKYEAKHSGNRIAYSISNMVRDRKRHRYYAALVHGRPDGSGQWWFHAHTGWLRIDEAINNRGGRSGFREGAQYIIEDHIG